MLRDAVVAVDDDDEEEEQPARLMNLFNASSGGALDKSALGGQV